MKKTTAILCIVGALLLGVAVTVYAQITYVNIAQKFDNTTSVPALGNVTPWVYTWHTVADSKGIAYGDCDATCRRQIVGEKTRELFNLWLYQQIAAKNNAAASQTTAAQVDALQSVLE